MPRRLTACVLPLLALGLASVASAEQAGNPAPPAETGPAKVEPTEAEPARQKREFFTQLTGRIRGLLDIDLPRFDPPGTYRIQINPRFGDLARRDYIRVPVGVRWTPDDRFEVNAEAESFFTHDHKAGDSGHGIGELRFGGRWLVPAWPAERDRTSVGVNFEIPVGSPPLDLTDGRNHIAPYIVVERRSVSRPRWTTFAGLSADLISDSSVPGRRGENTPTDDALSLTGGAICDLGPVKWTVQGTYTTSLLSGYDEHIFTVHPSVLWFVPKKYTFNSKTQWIVGVGVRGTWGPDGFDFGTGTRVRAEITFGQAIRRLRDTIAPRRGE